MFNSEMQNNQIQSAKTK